MNRQGKSARRFSSSRYYDTEREAQCAFKLLNKLGDETAGLLRASPQDGNGIVEFKRKPPSDS